MREYVLVLNPSHNRVYAAQAPELALAEADAMGRALSFPLCGLSTIRIGGADAITWTQENTPDPLEKACLARLSSGLLLLEKQGEMYSPVELGRISPEQEDLVTIPKYSGKTNEQFTRLMVNTALFSGAYAAEDPKNIRVLDPLCGRGTTLCEAMVMGHPAWGAELDKKEVEWFKNYFSQYLQHHRMKYTLDSENITNNKGTIAQRLRFSFAADKEAMKTAPSVCEMVRGDTLLSDKYFPNGYFHVLAADLPYGVQHGAQGKDGSLSRRPADMLRDALPVWYRLIAPGAALALAYNTNTLSPITAERIAEEAGFTVLAPGNGSFRHRVDASIDRDLLVARKE